MIALQMLSGMLGAREGESLQVMPGGGGMLILHRPMGDPREAGPRGATPLDPPAGRRAHPLLFTALGGDAAREVDQPLPQVSPLLGFRVYNLF